MYKRCLKTVIDDDAAEYCHFIFMNTHRFPNI